MSGPRLPPPFFPESEEGANARAREENKIAIRNALALGCCPECWADLQRQDGRWVCVACRWEERLVNGT